LCNVQAPVKKVGINLVLHIIFSYSITEIQIWTRQKIWSYVSSLVARVPLFNSSHVYKYEYLVSKKKGYPSLIKTTITPLKINIFWTGSLFTGDWVNFFVGHPVLGMLVGQNSTFSNFLIPDKKNHMNMELKNLRKKKYLDFD